MNKSSKKTTNSFDALLVDRLRRTADGRITERSGQALTEYDRMLAQNALNSRIAKAKGAVSLFTLVYEMYSEAVLFGDILDSELWTESMVRKAEEDYFAAAMSDIVSGRLIVRELFNMLRCNDIPEIQTLATAKQGLGSMATLICFAVKNEEATAWLDWHGKELPDWWLGLGKKKRAGTWSLNPIFKSTRRRKQVDILESLFDRMVWPPLAIPFGGKALLKSECIDGHKEHFTDESFEHCWSDLLEANLVRTVNHDLYSGKETKPISKG